MRKNKFLFCSILLAGFIASPVSYGKEIAHTLEGNPSIPEREIRGFYTDEAWHVIKDAPYYGYVVIRGQINIKSKFCPHEVIECYPDESKNKLAFKMSGEVKLSAASVGTRINPKADVYVVFYENDPEQRTALVFGKRHKATVVSENSLRDRYMRLFTY